MPPGHCPTIHAQWREIAKNKSLSALKINVSGDVAHTGGQTPREQAPTHHASIAVHGATLHYVVAGQGPRVMLPPGSPESWYAWGHGVLPVVNAGSESDTRMVRESEQAHQFPAIE